MKNKSGFTLLEIIIVIIIVGVLASLALPRFFSTVEYSRSTEALTSFTALRQSMERCYLQRSGSYANCNNINNLDVENPANSPNAHFSYSLTDTGGSGSPSATGYRIVATRGSRDGGDNTSTIFIDQTSTGVTRGGTGKFIGIQ